MTSCTTLITGLVFRPLMIASGLLFRKKITATTRSATPMIAWNGTSLSRTARASGRLATMTPDIAMNPARINKA